MILQGCAQTQHCEHMNSLFQAAKHAVQAAKHAAQAVKHAAQAVKVWNFPLN